MLIVLRSEGRLRSASRVRAATALLPPPKFRCRLGAPGRRARTDSSWGGSSCPDDLLAAVGVVPLGVFYIILFSLIAVLLVVAGATAMSRNKSQPPPGHHPSDRQRSQRKAKRAQSRHDRSKH